MAVAALPAADTNRSAPPMGLIAASAVGAVFVLGAAALVLRVLPGLWAASVGPAVTTAVNSLFSTALLLTVQIAAAVALAVAGSRLIASQKTAGVRGGIFFVICTIFIVFFCGRAVYLLASPSKFTAGTVVALLLNAVALFLVVQFYRTGRFTSWSLTVDQGGFFSPTFYKRSQGQKVRRFTTIGLLLIFFSGIWTLAHNNWLPANTVVKINGEDVSSRLGDWVVGSTLVAKPAPHREGGLTLLPDLNFTIPLVLVAAALWFAWRAVNYPPFADFLIATEAELNKVSWTPRKALIRDTLVVLTSLVLITIFLFVIDVFWGWLLSREWVGVLPTASEKPPAAVKQDAAQDW